MRFTNERPPQAVWGGAAFSRVSLPPWPPTAAGAVAKTVIAPADRVKSLGHGLVLP